MSPEESIFVRQSVLVCMIVPAAVKHLIVTRQPKFFVHLVNFIVHTNGFYCAMKICFRKELCYRFLVWSNILVVECSFLFYIQVSALGLLRCGMWLRRAGCRRRSECRLHRLKQDTWWFWTAPNGVSITCSRRHAPVTLLCRWSSARSAQQHLCRQE